MPAAPVIGGALAIGGSLLQSRSASRAADAQSDAADAGIAEQRHQFDTIQQLLAPFVGAGTGAISQMIALTGGAGDEAYQQQIASIEGSPEFQGLVEHGETAILQNASATGGLRGGNTQGALAQFRPEFLRNAINDRYSRLGGLAQIGQASAAGQASAGISTGNNISSLLQQQGAAQAGGIQAQGQIFGNILNGIGGTLFGGGGSGGGFTPGFTGGGF